MRIEVGVGVGVVLIIFGGIVTVIHPKISNVKMEIISVDKKELSCRMLTQSEDGTKVAFFGIYKKDVTYKATDLMQVDHWVQNCQLLSRRDFIYAQHNSRRWSDNEWYRYRDVRGESVP